MILRFTSETASRGTTQQVVSEFDAGLSLPGTICETEYTSLKIKHKSVRNCQRNYPSSCMDELKNLRAKSVRILAVIPQIMKPS